MNLFNATSQNLLQCTLDRARAQGASAAAVSLGHSENYGCSYAAGKLKNSGASEKEIITLEVIVDGRRGNATGTLLESLDTLIERAIALARIGATAYFDRYPAPAPSYPAIRQFSDTIATLTRERLIDDGAALIDCLRQLDPVMDTDASASRTISRSLQLNSSGFAEETHYSSWSLGCGFNRLNGQDMFYGGFYTGHRCVNDLYDLDDIRQRVTAEFHHGKNPVPGLSGSIPVLFDDNMFASFLGPVIAAMDGDAVFKGTSPLKDKLGQRCFAPALTITEHPHLDFESGSCSHDGYGIPSQPGTLIDAGLLPRFLYDYQTACMAKQQPTGHQNNAPANPRVRNGATAAATLLAGLKRGLYVKSLMGYGQGNIGNGDFSCNVALGYLVENGQIRGRVKDCMLSGNLFDLLRGEIQISADNDRHSQWPHLLLPAVNASSKS